MAIIIFLNCLNSRLQEVEELFDGWYNSSCTKSCIIYMFLICIQITQRSLEYPGYGNRRTNNSIHLLLKT